MIVKKRPEIERALGNPREHYRLVLLHGPDDAGSRALADRLAAAMGADAERIDLDGATLSKDPALLADEAASTSLFGGARWIRVRASGDEVTAAVEALLEAPQAGNPVVVIAGALKPASKLLKAVTASGEAIGFASYAPEGGEAVRIAADLARAKGLRMPNDVARRLVESCDNDRALIANEIEKLALFLDASESAPRDVTMAALDLIGAGESEADMNALVNAALTGNAAQLARELDRLNGDGLDAVGLLRAAFRRTLQLAQLRAEADGGKGIDGALAAAGKSLFWKDKATVEQELHLWNAAGLTTIIERLTEAQRGVMAPATAGPILAANEFAAIARAAARRR